MILVTHFLFFVPIGPFSYVLSQYIYVTGHGKRTHFAHYFKIDLLVFNGIVDLKQ